MTIEALRHAKHVIRLLFGSVGERGFDVRYWDDSVEPGGENAILTMVLKGPSTLRRMFLPPNELTIIEAFLSGAFDLEGDIVAAMTLADRVNRQLRSPANLITLVRHLTALPREDADSELRARRAANLVATRGARHAMERDEAAIRYHYDVGNDFYALWLDKRMVYSCAYYEQGIDPDRELDEAQRAKLDLVCRKLRLQPGERMLDVGCGWGGLIMHAAEHYGVKALGITLSEKQAELARERIAAAGLSDKCRVEIRDYRALEGEPAFDKISSIGMVEHVGEENLPVYFAALYAALKAGGLFLNHGILRLGDARPPGRWEWLEKRIWKRDAFIAQYVFPDMWIGPLSSVIAPAERVGFETRDVHTIREHYALTLRAWIRRLEQRAGEAIAVSDHRTVQAWRLCFAGAAYGFESGRLSVVQTLFAKADASGDVGQPLRRAI